MAKSKKDEPCYTRTSKSGKKYITCEGEQKRNKKLAKEISSLGKTSDKLEAKKKKTPELLFQTRNITGK